MNSGHIPWLRLLAEGAAIVVSILLAFVIDAAWDVRGELQEEREMLQGLRTEFLDVRERLDYWASFNRVRQDQAARALGSDGSEVSPVALDSLISAVPFVNVIDRGGGPLDAVLSSGRLELIRDQQLRESISRWPDRMEDLHTNDLTIRDFVWSNIVTYLASHGIPDGRCVREDLYCLHDSGAPEAYRSLLRDDQFRALLSFLRGTARVLANDQEEARDTADGMITRIDEYLKR